MNSLPILAMLLALTGQEAAPGIAECTVPIAPAVERPVKPQRPVTPSCVNETTHRHTCSNRVISAYEVSLNAYGVAFNAYVDAVNAYVGKLSAHVIATNAYVQCEQRIVMPSNLIQG